MDQSCRQRLLALRSRLLETSTIIQEARECVADAELLKDDKRYYQAKIVELQS